MSWSNIITPNYDSPTAHELAAFEARFEIALPEDYREFLCLYNGGRVNIKHRLSASIYGQSEQITVASLFPLSKARPFDGVSELRTSWEIDRIGMRSALLIGDDGGTGFFFILLSKQLRGKICFSYKDEFCTNSADWELEDELPGYMGLICDNFADLASLICHP